MRTTEYIATMETDGGVTFKVRFDSLSYNAAQAQARILSQGCRLKKIKEYRNDREDREYPSEVCTYE